MAYQQEQEAFIADRDCKERIAKLPSLSDTDIVDLARFSIKVGCIDIKHAHHTAIVNDLCRRLLDKGA